MLWVRYVACEGWRVQNKLISKLFVALQGVALYVIYFLITRNKVEENNVTKNADRAPCLQV